MEEGAGVGRREGEKEKGGGEREKERFGSIKKKQRKS